MPPAIGDVVVLDQHRVVEAEPMVAAAADAHRVFLERAQARRRLARVDDPRVGCGRTDSTIAARDRGDPAQVAEES